ncbi:PAS domain S-box protein [Chitinophaga sp. XS-30]|uniref:PAS domain S-box protein n=1 Tax=Chitinophaga sp. XS-30 TaxID=2604421 RepID=UPI0011DE2B37|nr:PAS domain S-box protein [Chitinophaga sp. XS-30]QEH43053.1 PAS domain S-box protein [Chitinophaga sp. XS-30]
MFKPITPLTTVIIYAICGILWILVTDTLLIQLPWQLSSLWLGQHFKGILYILLSSFLLYGLIRRNIARLELSQKAYMRMFRENPQPMWIFSKKTFRFLEVNDAAILLYGYSREEFLQMTILDIRPPEDIPKIRGNQQKQGNSPITSGNWQHYKKDGNLMYVRVEAFATTYEKEPAEVVTIFDITGQYLADDALKKQEQLLKTMINSTHNMVWAVSTRLELIAFNDTFRRHSGLFEGISEPSDYWRMYYEKCLAGEKQLFEYRMEDKDEDWQFAEISFEPILHKDRITGVACLAQNITERKRHEIALKKALERYDLISLATNDAIWDYDLASNKISWNEKMQQYYGFAGLEADVSYWQDRIHPEDREIMMRSVGEAVYKKQSRWQGEYRMLGVKGEYRHVISRGYILYNEKGEPYRLIGALQDVEDKVQQQEEIRKLSLIASMTHNPVIISDPEAHIEWVNKSFEDLTGYTLEEVRGKQPSSFLHGPGTNPRTLQEIQEKLSTSQPCVVEILNYTSDGEPYWVLMDITPVVDASGKIEHLIIIQTNITEKKKFVQQLEEKNKLLMEVAYISSHRLRKPVASMLGVIALMDKADLSNPENERLIAYIERLTNEMDTMLHEMADKCNRIYEVELRQNDPLF